jgi:hypothetical protein
VAEAAVVGVNDELTGQAVNAFVALKDGNDNTDQTKKDLIVQVRKSIGPFAAPKAIFVVPDLPKTRSGKIMRRILRKILAGEEDQLGDTTTVSDALHSLVVCHERCALRSATRVVCLECGLTLGSCRIRRWWTKSLTWCIRPRRSRRTCEAFEWRAVSLASQVAWRRGRDGRRWVRPDGYRLALCASSVWPWKSRTHAVSADIVVFCVRVNGGCLRYPVARRQNVYRVHANMRCDGGYCSDGARRPKNSMPFTPAAGVACRASRFRSGFGPAPVTCSQGDEEAGRRAVHLC